jgi:hypothetical protein
MSFKSEVDAEAEKLIKQGVPPMEALKHAIQTVAERLSSEMEQTDEQSQSLKKPE